jgi:hypothetical protein
LLTITLLGSLSLSCLAAPTFSAVPVRNGVVPPAEIHCSYKGQLISETPGNYFMSPFGLGPMSFLISPSSPNAIMKNPKTLELACDANEQTFTVYAANRAGVSASSVKFTLSKSAA